MTDANLIRFLGAQDQVYRSLKGGKKSPKAFDADRHRSICRGIRRMRRRR
jgi:hypothetical protein